MEIPVFGPQVQTTFLTCLVLMLAYLYGHTYKVTIHLFKKNLPTDLFLLTVLTPKGKNLFWSGGQTRVQHLVVM